MESIESIESIENGRIYYIPIESDRFPRIWQNIAEFSGEVFPDVVLELMKMLCVMDQKLPKDHCLTLPKGWHK